MNSKGVFNFNKEIIFGEIGTCTGVQIVNLLPLLINLQINLVPYLVVVGAMIFGSGAWLLTRIHDQSKEKKYTKKKLLNDIKYFTPASVLGTLIFYHPALFFTTKYFLEHHRPLLFSTIVSEVIAFSLFITTMNVYRIVLFKITGKKL